MLALHFRDLCVWLTASLFLYAKSLYQVVSEMLFHDLYV